MGPGDSRGGLYPTMNLLPWVMKSASLWLALFLLLQPFAIAFAQESGEGGGFSGSITTNHNVTLFDKSQNRNNLTVKGLMKDLIKTMKQLVSLLESSKKKNEKTGKDTNSKNKGS